jgi:hypothetical protein
MKLGPIYVYNLYNPIDLQPSTMPFLRSTIPLRGPRQIFGLVFATKGFPKYNDHMNGALSSRAATGQLRHVKHDVKVPIDHFESQMGHVSQSQVVTGMFFAMEPDSVERRLVPPVVFLVRLRRGNQLQFCFLSQTRP